MEAERDPSEAARQRLLSLPGEPLFIADWERVLQMHYEVDASVVPYDLDLRCGRAFVTVVAFTMRGMRPRFGGRWSACLLRPIATHHFLNVRTYVRHRGETGILFMAEWLPNRLSVALGPRTFGLPYRLGRIAYRNGGIADMSGEVEDAGGHGAFFFRARLDFEEGLQPCEPGSLCEWLMERYSAFTPARGRGRFFRVWHRPWMQAPAKVELSEQSLLERNWGFFNSARLVSAHFSPGVRDVWMGWPHRVAAGRRSRRLAAEKSHFYT